MDIYNKSDYISYNFQWNSLDFPKITVLLGPFYLFPTFYIVGKMAKLFFDANQTTMASSIQKHLFMAFLFMQIANFFYIITDFIVVRIPATGILTSICAQIAPNQVLKLPYLIAFISSYVSMLFPVIFCANRAIIVFYPKNHNEICRRFMKFSLPITVILPCCFTFFMVPAVGHCTQLTAPYPMGAVMFTLDLKVRINEYTHLLTSFFCTLFTFSINITMMVKVRHILFQKKFFNRNINKNYKAEMSLTITMVLVFIPFLVNGIVVVLSLRDPSLIGYILSIRPIAIDTATVFEPWAFYLTHPFFGRYKRKTTVSSFPRNATSSVSTQPI
ncbi:Serpentine Receptor, class U [Caenorhabditis elegans]|uniref:Serpentine Receptor, class U n=1 Tax=Caenorhabditis elegans TaxID=6239 RepID=Q9XV42_CAEEL|nr:Serpentine Receptor, class U [Caenorhabditis elegans]CAB04305.2 Serpentine Receptor, class U [Caenorhabditis elegans]|eukprot:NP_492898.2 Serpentine Receptor, class U [Caenorhabditis elegans]